MAANKHDELTLRLLDAVRSQRYGERFPALRELGGEYGAALRTVCKAVEPLLAAGLVQPGPHGSVIRRFNSGRNFRTIGVVGVTFDVPGDDAMSRALGPIAEAAGYDVIDIRLKDNVLRDDPEYLVHFPVDGILFIYSSMSAVSLAALRRAGIPLVAGAKWWGPGKVVQSDGDLASGYRKLVNTLRKLGHKRIGWFSPERPREYRGYLDYMREIMEKETCGGFAPELFFTPSPHLEWLVDGDAAYYRRMAESAVEYFGKLDSPPSAVIAGQAFAEPMREILRARGIETPRDISLACVDSNGVPTADFTGVWYSAVERAVWGMKRLLEMLRGELPQSCRMNQAPLWLPGATVGPAGKDQLHSHNR